MPEVRESLGDQGVAAGPFILGEWKVWGVGRFGARSSPLAEVTG